MTDFPFAIVGFDLDGTIVDSAADITGAVNAALAVAGRPLLRLDDVRPMIGGGARALLERTLEQTGGCTPDDARHYLQVLLAHYEAHVADHTRPFPGAVETIDELRAMGVRVAVVTNKFERFARKLLDALGIADRFETVIGGDTLGRGRAKPAPDPILEMIARLGGGRAAFVGDSVYDTGAARAAGIPSIGCAFGFLLGPVEELGADAIIDGWDALIPALRHVA